MDEMKLLSYFNGELSEEEVLQVETWSKASEENRKLLEQIYYTAFVGDRVAVMNSVDVEGSLKKLKVAMKPKESAVKEASLYWLEALCYSIGCFSHWNCIYYRLFLFGIK